MLVNDNERSKRIRIYTILNFIFKGVGVFCSFLMVPIALGYLNKSDYGVWLTLTSITAWLAVMDVGLGNGLRNKLTESIAQNDVDSAKEYVSTAYFAFIVLIFSILILFGIVNVFLDWNAILKTNINPKQLSLTAYLVVASLGFRLMLELATTITTALEKPYVKTLTDSIINITTLISIFVLNKFFSSSIITFCVVVAIIPVLVLSVFNYAFFSHSNFSYLKPNIVHFKKVHLSSLLNLGLQFFIIQIAGVVIFATDNLLITQLFSPTEVTSFNIANKYFSICTFLFSIILLPYWSAFTNAYIKKDIKWITGAFKKLLIFWVLQVLGILILLALSNKFYSVWFHNEVKIPFVLSVACAGYVLIFNWNNIFAYFINGVGKVRLQVYFSIIIGVINIPLSIFLVKYLHYGVWGIVLSNCLCLLLNAVWVPIQSYKIVNGSANGIWDQ